MYLLNVTLGVATSSHVSYGVTKSTGFHTKSSVAVIFRFVNFPFKFSGTSPVEYSTQSPRAGTLVVRLPNPSAQY